MSDFNLCPTCREYDWLEKHKCPPKFYFKHENWGDEFQEIYASYFEEAAEKFARLYNENGDYALMDGSEEKVLISDGKTEKTFVVRAEQAIDYFAEEIKN